MNTQVQHVAIVPFGSREPTGLAEIPMDLYVFMKGPNLLACGLRQLRPLSPVVYDTLLAFETHIILHDVVENMIAFRTKKDAAWANGITVDSNDGEQSRSNRLTSVVKHLIKKHDEHGRIVVQWIDSLYDHKGNLSVFWNRVPYPEFIRMVNDTWGNEEVCGEESCQVTHLMLSSDGTRYVEIHQGCFHCTCNYPHIEQPETWLESTEVYPPPKV